MMFCDFETKKNGYWKSFCENQNLLSILRNDICVGLKLFWLNFGEKNVIEKLLVEIKWKLCDFVKKTKNLVYVLQKEISGVSSKIWVRMLVWLFWNVRIRL